MVSDAAVAQKAVRIANEFLMTVETDQRPRSGGFANSNALVEGADTGVINMLRVASGQQVMLRVRVGEIERGTLKQLGVNWSASNTGNFSFATSGTKTTDTFATLGGTIASGGATLTATLEALEENNLFKLLAEPNLVAMSGEEADFLSGGEFPVPVAATDDQVSIEFKSFGVAVKFIPHVLSNSRIRIAVNPEVSERDDENGLPLFTGAGTITIPAIKTRRAKTTVELAPGESFMIAGLMKDVSTSGIDQVPGLGEVPVLSALFRDTSFTREETELVIAVTPYLVDPVTGDEVRMPTDSFRHASMMEQFFYGALGSLSGDTLRVSQTPSLEGPIGFMVD
jgi:pilus assembly protein CpaC